MPRGGRRSSGRSTSSSLFSKKPAPKAAVPARAPPSSVASPSAQPRQPGMLGQIASTAAGVAIGSTVGHVVGGALMGGHGSSDNNQVSDQPMGYQQQSYQPGQQQQNPCHFELQQFVECAQNQSDISYCQGVNEVLKQCKLQYDDSGKKKFRENESTGNNYEEIHSNALETQEFAEVVIDLKFGQKHEYYVKHATALRNSCGGIIRIKHSRSEKDVNDWISSYSTKEREQTRDSIEPSDIKHTQDEILIFVSKSASIITPKSYAYRRWEKSIESVKSFEKLGEMLNNTSSTRNCICKSTNKILTSFTLDEKVHKAESSTIEFKDYSKCNLNSKLSTVPSYVGAFANTNGGTIYIGIDDNGKVVGQPIKPEEVEEMKGKIYGRIKQMIWLLSSSKQAITPIFEKHFRISFVPVQGAQDKIIIVIHICSFAGTVFLSKPECPTINDMGEVINMDFDEWLLYHQVIVEKNEKYRTKRFGNTFYKELKGTVEDTLNDIENQMRVHPKNADVWIGEETLNSFLQYLGNAHLSSKGGHVFVQKSWYAVLGKSSDKPSSVICDILLCLRDFPLVFITISDNLTNDAHHYNRKLATLIKRELTQEAGCLEKFFIVPLVLSPKGFIAEFEAQKDCLKDKYPHVFSMCEDKYSKILKALSMILARVNSSLTSESKQKHYNVLTKDQYDILDEFYGNSSNIHIKGLPGSGKTLLALERAHRLRVADGYAYEEVLYLCSNKPLAATVGSTTMAHDGKPLCTVWYYHECEKKIRKNKICDKNFVHVIVDEVQNFKKFPQQCSEGTWFNKFLHSICMNEESTVWIFSDYSQRIAEEQVVEVPTRYTTKVLKEVIRTTKKIHNFCQRYLQGNPDNTGVSFAHDIQGNIPKILISPDYEDENKRQSAADIILFQVLSSLIVEKAHEPSSITVLFADDNMRKNYTDLFKVEAQDLQIRNGEDVNKEGVILESIRRYSGLQNSIVIGFCPEYYTSGHIQNNKALMLALCSRPETELVLIFNSKSQASDFDIEEEEMEVVDPEDNNTWNF